MPHNYPVSPCGGEGHRALELEALQSSPHPQVANSHAVMNQAGQQQTTVYILLKTFKSKFYYNSMLSYLVFGETQRPNVLLKVN